jgi:endonuclease/exonuclease/phosphatase family metal-dependent hydrolase
MADEFDRLYVPVRAAVASNGSLICFVAYEVPTQETCLTAIQGRIADGRQRPKEGSVMRKIIGLIIFLIPLLGGGWFFAKYKIAGLNDVVFLPRDSGSGSGIGTEQISIGDPREPDTVRIASFNIQVFGTKKLEDLQVMDILTHIVRQFDVVAIQEIRTVDQTLMAQFVRRINATGARYDYVLGPRLGRTSSKEQYAFVFDTTTIEVDRRSVYTLSDPYDRMHREPLVALFRTRGAPPDEAFTFKLVNVHTDPDDVPEEMNAMDDVYRAVLNDGDGEDDVILVGDFNTSEKNLYQVADVSDITTALRDVTTNTKRTESYDNLIFSSRHTSEFLGRSGVLDIVRAFNTTTDVAEAVSDHLPVWGLFSIYEGGRTPRVAAAPGPAAETR